MVVNKEIKHIHQVILILSEISMIIKIILLRTYHIGDLFPTNTGVREGVLPSLSNIFMEDITNRLP